MSGFNFCNDATASREKEQLPGMTFKGIHNLNFFISSTILIYIYTQCHIRPFQSPECKVLLYPCAHAIPFVPSLIPVSIKISKRQWILAGTQRRAGCVFSMLPLRPNFLNYSSYLLTCLPPIIVCVADNV